MEKNLGRKLTPEEKKKVEEKMGHVEISEIDDEDENENYEKEEVEVLA